MEYAIKRVMNLKPSWYHEMGRKQKLEYQNQLKEEEAHYWERKPDPLSTGDLIESKMSSKSLSNGGIYKVLNHFCTLVSTVHGSEWHQFVTIKNDYGFTVKMNLNKFKVLPKQ